MKMIDLFFCPIKFSVNYRKCKQQLENNDEIVLFSKYAAKIILTRTIFNKVNITFILDDFDTIDEINDLLFKEYGIPNSIRYEKTYVWKLGKIYITHGEEDTYYQDSKHIINISFIYPLMGMDYSYYMYIDKNIKPILEVWNFEKRFQFISPTKWIEYFYETKDFRYIFSIKKGKIILGAYEIKKEGKSSEEWIRWKQKTSFKSIKELELIINSFLSYIEEYDTGLKQNILSN